MTYHGGCQCGAVAFEADGEIEQLVECNCSICKPKGYLLWFVPEADFRLKTDEAALTEYRFNTGTAKHYFCAACGIYTHHQRRSNPRQFGVNVACIEGVSPFDEVPVNDGINHPSDRPPGAKGGLAGMLRYEPASGS